MTTVVKQICLIQWKVQTISWKDPWNGISRYQQPSRMFLRLQNGTEPPLFKLNVSFLCFFFFKSQTSFAILFRSHLANSSHLMHFLDLKYFFINFGWKNEIAPGRNAFKSFILTQFYSLFSFVFSIKPNHSSVLEMKATFINFN